MPDEAGLADPAYHVPPLRARSTPRFALIFLLTLAGWTLCLPLITFAWVNRYDSGEAAFVEGLYRRKAVALRRAVERAGAAGNARLVVVGGSGALLGIDAELIERKLGVPCVNLATHAGLGGEYLLDRARRELRPGDWVLLSPEYQLWGNPSGDAFNDLEWQYVVSYDKRFLLGLDRLRLLKLMYSVPVGDYVQSARGWLDRARGAHYHTRGGYNLAALSPNGDLRANLARGNFGLNPGYPFPDVDRAARVGDFRRFANWARDTNVRVFFTWPNGVRPDLPVPPGGDVPPGKLTALLDELGFVVLDAPRDTAFPRAWYTDTAYHLDACARRLRTEELVRRLRPHLGLPPAPEKPTGYYLVSSPAHRPNEINVLAGDPGVRVKYLSDAPVDHPDAVTPGGVAGLVSGGLPAYFDEAEIGARLAPLGWQSDVVLETKASLPQWLRSYDRHVLLVARAGQVTSRTSASVAPPELAQALRRPAAFAAAVGTGSFRHVRQLASGRAGASAQLKADLRSLTRRDIPQLAISIESPAIRVNRQDWAPADRSASAWVIAVVVIDPDMGVVDDSAAFPDAGDDAVPIRSLRRLRRAR